MEPVELAGNAKAGFVGMSDGCPSEEVRHPGFKTSQCVVGGGDGSLNGGLADGPAEKIDGHLTDAFQRDQLLAAQVDEPGVETRSVLSGSVDVGWKIGRDFAAGVGTDFNLGAMLGDGELLRGQIEHLSFFVAKHGLPIQRSTATAGAKLERMHDNEIRFGHRRQGVARMSVLSAGREPALFAQTFGTGFGVAVG